jgi:hypothetical protein
MQNCSRLWATGACQTNKHKLVARIDRKDWLQSMAKSLHRAPADFYVPGENHVAPNWCDYYRRVHSKDQLEVSAEIYAALPASNETSDDYVPLPSQKIDMSLRQELLVLIQAIQQERALSRRCYCETRELDSAVALTNKALDALNQKVNQ